MKKKIQRCLVITLILLCGITLGFSTAFISRSISAHNVITFGKVKMQVHETYLDPNGNELPFEQERVTKLTSDTMQNRLFRIENTGKHPLYVRLSFLVVGVDLPQPDGPTNTINSLSSMSRLKSVTAVTPDG